MTGPVKRMTAGVQERSRLDVMQMPTILMTQPPLLLLLLQLPQLLLLPMPQLLLLQLLQEHVLMDGLNLLRDASSFTIQVLCVWNRIYP